ncbi:MAG: hypothetical protein JNN15_10420 [Blastocatellia bacterium]|nr:hypothetical protein [Blastocatellia bacterium]
MQKRNFYRINFGKICEDRAFYLFDSLELLKVIEVALPIVEKLGEQKILKTVDDEIEEVYM